MTVPVPGDVAPGIVPATTDSLEAILRTVLGRLSEDQRKTLYSASISEGGLTVQGGGALRVKLPNGVEIFYAGPLTFLGVGYQGIIMRRADGTALFYTFPVSGNPAVIGWRWLDQLGTEVLSSDAITGGLARPWIPVYLVPKMAMAAGTFAYFNIAAPGAETQLWEGRIPLVSHPFVEVDGIWGQASGSNSTIYRLKVAGVQVGTWTVGGGLVADRRGPYDISANLSSTWVAIELTAQSTGSGQVACHVKGCAIRQT
jgi:hypothetical protein